MFIQLRGVLWVAVLAVGMQGCTSSMALRDPELRRRASSIAIVKPEELPGRKYTLLGEVSASTCTSGIYRTNYSPAALHEVLKGEAARLHADAVTNVACDEGGVRFDCWTSFECRGDALRWEAVPPAAPSMGPKVAAATPE